MVPATVATPPDGIRRFTRAEYERLVAQGWFAGEPIELLHGMLLTMSPQGPRHSEVIKRLTKLLIRALGDRCDVFVQSPFAAADDSEPEPDLAVVPPGDYTRAHPEEAFLIIEVAQTSLARDRDMKAALYAQAGVPEYWIVDLEDHVIQVHTRPAEDRYRTTTEHRAGATIALHAFPDVRVPVTDVL